MTPCRIAAVAKLLGHPPADARHPERMPARRAQLLAVQTKASRSRSAAAPCAQSPACTPTRPCRHSAQAPGRPAPAIQSAAGPSWSTPACLWRSTNSDAAAADPDSGRRTSDSRSSNSPCRNSSADRPDGPPTSSTRCRRATNPTNPSGFEIFAGGATQHGNDPAS